MLRRFTDFERHALRAESEGEFIRRALTPGRLQMAVGMVAITSCCIAIYSLSHSITMFAGLTIGLFLLVFLVVDRVFGGINHAVFTNEFKHSMFAGAAGTGYEFVCIVRDDKHIVYYNPMCERYFGKGEQGEDSLLAALQKIGFGDSQLLKISAGFDDHSEVEIKATIQTFEGDSVHVIASLRPIDRPKGFFVFKVLRDPSKIYTPEISKTPFSDALTLVWNHFLDHSPLALVTFNNDSIITRFNAAFYAMCDPSTLKGEELHLIDIISPQSHDNAKELLHKVIDEQQHIVQPVDIILAGEHKRSASLYVTSINNDQDGDNFVAYLIDTTEQKNLEHRFVHSQKMQAVGQLAGGVAHDFNNLLTAMIGFCDLLLVKHPPGDPSFADIMQIKQNANRAANLVRQLLAFSRKQTLQPALIDLSETLSELSNLIRRLIGENIELEMQYGRELYHVKVDKGQFEQVIINLAVNARDAMNEGAVNAAGKLDIITRNEVVDEQHPLPQELIGAPESETLPQGEYVVIEVRDTGSGMSKDVMKQIFEPFFTTKKMGEGTGLGLSTVYGIIQQTGGYIFVRSMQGQGTSFLIYLRKYDEPEQGTEQLSDTQQLTDLTGKGTILLVEDEIPVRTFSSRALQNKGYEVFEADSGEQGLQIIEKYEGRISVIITDVMMPGMTGPDMVEQIHATYPHIPVIFISGYGEDAFMSSYGSKRSFNFLPKPFTLNQLAQKVKEVMS